MCFYNYPKKSGDRNTNSNTKKYIRFPEFRTEKKPRDF